jgi:hypothetical protein
VQRFEHHSPSDFWGDHLSDIGRAHFVNKYENKRRFGRNITIASPTVVNYFGDLVRTLENDSHGDLIAVDLKDNQIMLAISEHNNSMHRVGNDFLKVGSDGIVRAVDAEQIISDGQPKVSGMYGCQYPHIGSVFFGDGFATWVDVNNGTFVKHDYRIAAAADVDKAQTYFSARCQEILTNNKAVSDPLDKLRFATGVDNNSGAVMITIKALRHGGIYNEIKPFLKPNDTILYDPDSGDFLTFASFTPEAYGMINISDQLGCAFVSFLNGIPYIHPLNPTKWNEFFGVAVDRVVGISMNKFPEKIKKGLAIEVQDETMWYVADVSTDNVNFRSEIPPKRMVKDRNKWNGAFLKDINSRGGLYNGKEASGFYHAVTLIRDNVVDNQYGVIDNTKRVAYDSLDMVHIKFVAIEQSGFTANL